jgi:hypothetical protein
MAHLISDRSYKVVAYAQGARWDLITGLSTREAADRAVAALIARDGMRATDATGRMTAVTFGIEVV